MVKDMSTRETLVIPDNVTLECHARSIKVTGPRGSLSRDFKHAKVRSNTVALPILLLNHANDSI
jgi:ribosomal protein L6P/L9E